MGLRAFITNNKTKPWVLIISELALSALLKLDHSLTLLGMLVVLLFWAIICHLFIGWLKFEGEFKKLQEKEDLFFSEWQTFKSNFASLQFDVSEIKVSKSRTGKMLDKFAKSNLLVESISNNLKDDLELDELITTDNDKIKKDFHSYISSLKYHKFLTSHFIINAKEKEVLQIPSYYFKRMIWKEFVDKAYRYLSVQLMDNEQAKKYLGDPERLKYEIDFLDQKTKGENSTHIEKIFVINNKYFDKNEKIKDREMKKYLNVWNNEFKNKYEVIPVLVIEEAKALKCFGEERKYLTDIGIFGDIYGIQSINDKDDKFYVDELKINFYFDKAKTDKKVEYFEKLKIEAKPLSDVLN